MRGLFRVVTIGSLSRLYFVCGDSSTCCSGGSLELDGKCVKMCCGPAQTWKDVLGIDPLSIFDILAIPNDPRKNRVATERTV